MQYVCYNNVQSDKRSKSQGVTHGSVMSPTLFLIYINDIFKQLPSGSVVAYADDVTMLANGDTANMATNALQYLNDIVGGWFSINCQSLNAAKCSTMCVVPSKKAATGYPHHTPNINSFPIPWVHSVKIFGVFFTNDFDWRQHAKSGWTTM